MKPKKAWAITDWNGEIKHLSISIFDTKKEALRELRYLQSLPDPDKKGKNEIIRVEIKKIN